MNRFGPLRMAAAGFYVFALLAGSIGATGATEQSAANPQSTYQPPISQTTRLQITGSGNSLTLDVERADVQGTLKAVLKQAGKQFAPDASVTGTVTLLLTDQPLEAVLRAVCDQCYLQYRADATGVYRFTRDDEAIKRAFSQLKQLNTQLRGQLRSMGLDVPSEEIVARSRMRGGSQSEVGGAPGAAGPAARAFQDAAKPDRDLRNAPSGDPSSSAKINVPSSRRASLAVRRNCSMSP